MTHPTPAEAEFVRWGVSHGLAIMATLALPILLGRWSRRDDSGGRGRAVGRVIAGLLLLTWIGSLWNGLRERGGDWTQSLPLHLCDWAAAAVMIALITRRQVAFELAYFWGLAGTVQGLLTPDLAHGFPHPRCVLFFAAHCGIVVGALFLVWGGGMRPRPGSVGRVLLWTNLYGTIALAANLCLGTNYGYILRKPLQPSLLDHLGPWPWYLLSLELLALLLFTFLDLPFRRGRRRPANA